MGGGHTRSRKVTFDLILQWVSRMSQPWGNESNRLFRVLIDALDEEKARDLIQRDIHIAIPH